MDSLSENDPCVKYTIPDSFPTAHTISIAAEPSEPPTGTELIARYGRDSEPGSKPRGEDVTVFLAARNARGEPVGCGTPRDLGGSAVEIKRETEGFERRLGGSP